LDGIKWCTVETRKLAEGYQSPDLERGVSAEADEDFEILQEFEVEEDSELPGVVQEDDPVGGRFESLRRPDIVGQHALWGDVLGRSFQ
jgi:hypothetical protein